MSASGNQRSRPSPSRWSKRRTRWLIVAVLLALAIVPEFFVTHYAHFESLGIELDARFGFYAWYSFFACGAMIAIAKLLGIFLKRRDSYYDE